MFVLVACSDSTSPPLPHFAGVISNITKDQIFSATASSGEAKHFSVTRNTTLLRRQGGPITFDSLTLGRVVGVDYIEGVVLIDLDQAITITLEP